MGEHEFFLAIKNWARGERRCSIRRGGSIRKRFNKATTISLLIFSKTICTLNLGRVCQAKCSKCSHIFIQFWGLSRAVKSARTMLGQNHVMIKMAGIEEYIDEEGD